MTTSAISVFPKASAAVHKPRVCWSIEGEGGVGKTHLACQAPGPILFLPFDVRSMPVIYKHVQEGKVIHLPPGGPYRQVFSDPLNPGELQDTSKATWARFRNDLIDGAKAGFRTIVVDTASEAWHCYVLSRYGRDASIPQHMWGALYFAFSSELRLAYDGSPETNLLLIHQLKDEYRDTGMVDEKKKAVSVRTGERKRDGANKMDYLLGSEIRLRFDPPTQQFFALFKVCKTNTNMWGKEVELPWGAPSFQLLAMEAEPDVDPSVWE